jgi:D-alanyl-D-alanine-carboxypeptidase/D-alanyl-D-alanine-endopeptidase
VTSRTFRVVRALSVIFTLAVYSAFAAPPSSAPPPGVTGFWMGTMVQNGITFRVVLQVAEEGGGKLRVSMRSVDQNATLPAETPILKDNSFSFEVRSVGKYRGTLAASGNTLSGTWTQQGESVTLNFARTSASAVPTPVPLSPARPPLALNQLKPVLDRELEPLLKNSLLSKRTGGGLVIGVLDHGQRRIFTYGTAHPDSIFEIGSITKTFTGLILAQMVAQKEVTLSEPVIELLPKEFGKPSPNPQISLLDLATQYSSLPRDADNFDPKNTSNPYADYDSRKLSEYVVQRGLTKPEGTTFQYSNVGFGLLGYALSSRSGIPYEKLLQNQVTSPLQLHDTVITLSPEQRKRLIQGYDASFNRADAWDFDALAGAGAIKSTASDMLTYLEANLHPEKYATGAAPGSSTATLPAAIALDHEPQADTGPEGKIALAWMIDVKTDSFDSEGQSGAYGTVAIFNPTKDWAVIALYNRAGHFPRFVDNVGENVSQLLLGQPSVHLDELPEDEKNALAHLSERGSTSEAQQ